MSIFHTTDLDDILLSYLTNHKYNLALTNRYYRNKIFGHLKTITNKINYGNISEYVYDIDIIKYWLSYRNIYYDEVQNACESLIFKKHQNNAEIAKILVKFIKKRQYYDDNMLFNILQECNYLSMLQHRYDFNVLDIYFSYVQTTKKSKKYFATVEHNDRYICMPYYILLCRNARYDIININFPSLVGLEARNDYIIFKWNHYHHVYVDRKIIDDMVQTVKQRNHTEILNYLKDLFKNTKYVIN